MTSGNLPALHVLVLSFHSLFCNSPEILTMASSQSVLAFLVILGYTLKSLGELEKYIDAPLPPDKPNPACSSGWGTSPLVPRLPEDPSRRAWGGGLFKAISWCSLHLASTVRMGSPEESNKRKERNKKCALDKRLLNWDYLMWGIRHISALELWSCNQRLPNLSVTLQRVTSWLRLLDISCSLTALCSPGWP